MKLDGPLPEHFLSKLPPEERKRLGRAGMTSEEAQVRYIARTERELQRDVANYLNLHQIPFFNPRMDRKSTVQVGMPDFVICLPPSGKFVGVECKCAATGGKLSSEQEASMARILAAGGTYLIIYSLEQLIQALAAS